MNHQPFHLSLSYSTVVCTRSSSLERDRVAVTACVVCCGGSSIVSNAGHRFVVLGIMTSHLSHCHVKPQRKSRSTLSLLVE